jgi:hypothetical protein
MTMEALHCFTQISPQSEQQQFPLASAFLLTLKCPRPADVGDASALHSDAPERRSVQLLHSKVTAPVCSSLQCHLSSTIVNEIPESAQLAGPILPIRSIAMRRLPVGLQLGTLCGVRRYGWDGLG